MVLASSPSPSLLAQCHLPQRGRQGPCRCVLGSPFERLPPVGGRCRAATKRGQGVTEGDGEGAPAPLRGAAAAAAEGPINRRCAKNAFSEAASIFPLRLLPWGLKGACSPFLVAGWVESRGREGGVETPLPASGPAERPGALSKRHSLSPRKALYTTKKPRSVSASRRLSWSCYPDSNWRPHPYQGCALPTEL